MRRGVGALLGRGVVAGMDLIRVRFKPLELLRGEGIVDYSCTVAHLTVSLVQFAQSHFEISGLSCCERTLATWGRESLDAKQPLLGRGLPTCLVIFAWLPLHFAGYAFHFPWDALHLAGCGGDLAGSALYLARRGSDLARSALDLAGLSARGSWGITV